MMPAHIRGPALALVAAVGAVAVVGCAQGSHPRGTGRPAELAQATQEVRAPLPEGVEARSFLGEDLTIPALPRDVEDARMRSFRDAELALEENPDDAGALIWMGRRTAYLGRYQDAIDIYSHALSLHPDDPRIYRHRGHRYITVRELGPAIDDLRRAADLIAGRPDEVEPDGLPNARNIPTSTLHFNIWYHLGLAYYLQGDFAAAAEAYRRCLSVARHADAKVAASYWLYLTLRRLHREDEARRIADGVRDDMDVIESGSYLDLLDLFKGRRTPERLLGPQGSEATLESTTTAYGVGMWYLLDGNKDDARRTFEQILADRDQWAAFGYIAAEAELAGLGSR
ncbi:MAG: tetratricopeptide repeat protein [Gemmatimonadetes bacterium]|nr:tetratricopeptide repeat protein [Gemmatimonadota bacterium]